MSYILQKPIPSEYHSKILNETKAVRELLPSYCIFQSDRMLAIYLDDNELSWAINFETGDYLMEVMTNGQGESHLYKFLFFYEQKFYFFFLKMSSDNKIFFYINTPFPKENFEVFQQNLSESFFVLHRKGSQSWLENIKPVIHLELSKEF